jgi:DNA-directed RNA polymerase delta subunit
MEKVKMTNLDRKNIIREIKKRIKKNKKDYPSIAVGFTELVQDNYIHEVCKELGWTINEFYTTDGKELDKLLAKL